MKSHTPSACSSTLARPWLGVLLGAVLGCSPSAHQLDKSAAAPAAPAPLPAASPGPRPSIAGLPDTPAGRQLGGWLEAFNSQQRAALLAFHQRHFPYAAASRDVADIEREHRLSQGTGGFEVRRIEQSEGTRVVALLKERNSPQHARVRLGVAPEPPHAVTKFQIGPVPTPLEVLSPEERKARTIDQAQRLATLESIVNQLNEHYVSVETAQVVSAGLQKKRARGDYDGLTDAVQFADVLGRDLQRLARDPHLALVFGPMPRPPDLAAKAPPGLARFGYGFGASQRLEGNVALLTISGFPPLFDEQKAAIGQRMSEIADADAVIVDLRANGGGFPPTEQHIASYFFDEQPIVLKQLYSRDTDRIDEIWTERELSGKRIGAHKPVYVLTGERTFSGGEALAYELQAHGRAVVVGVRTRGGAHAAWPYPVEGGFVLRVPRWRSSDPITGTNWEGIGIVPDIDVPEEEALETAHRLALEKLGRR
jgi:hypothetical protein